MINRLFFTFGLVCLLLISGTSAAVASIISVKENGEITWNVLSEQDSTDADVPTHSYIEVKRVGDDAVDPRTSIELSKAGNKVSLSVFKDNEERQIDITNSNGNLIEIEERAEIQKINIGIRDDRFSLQQRGIIALTDYPIKIDSQTANLTVGTDSGDRYLSILPYQAVQGVLRSRLISRVNDNRMEIIEVDEELQYSFSGEKVFDIFGFFEYKIPVSIKVSASTGETVSIEGPTWYKVIGFFLS